MSTYNKKEKHMKLTRTGMIGLTQKNTAEHKKD